jgi:hypothetical protein
MKERRMHVPGAGGLSLCILFLLCLGSHAPSAVELEDTPSFFSLLLFFLPIDLTVDGAINGDQAKHTTSDQLLLTLATLCKGEKVCEVRFGNNAVKRKIWQREMPRCKT